MSSQSRDLGVVIRPMGLGEVLDAGFSLARNNFRLLVKVAAWGVIPGQALSALGLALLAGFDDIAITATLSVATLIASLFAAFGGTLAFFALLIATAKLIDPESSNVPLQVWPLYRAGIGRLFIWALFILGMTILAIPLLILFPLGIFLAVRWSMAANPLIVERSGPLAALKRSWALTSGAWWHTALILFVTGLVMSLLQGAISMVLTFGGMMVGGLSGGAIGTFLSMLGTAFASVIFTPFSTAIYMVLYYELRARAEGFDLTQRAHQLASPTE